MKRKVFRNCSFLRILILFTVFVCNTNSYAQQYADTLRGRNLYNPERLSAKDTIYSPFQPGDTAQAIRDSLERRMQFVRDSIIAREQFVRDSILRRQRIMDSLVFLQKELPVLLDAYLKTIKEDIMLNNRKIEIIGDSVLSDYGYLTLPFNLTQPYTPWRVRLDLSGMILNIKTDKTIQKIASIQAPFMKCSLTYGSGENLLVINELSAIQNDRWGNFYKTPVDSVFFDRNKRVVKIKRYVHFYGIVNKSQRGAPLFLNLSQVKQYEYGPDNQITRYQVVNFCDRWKAYEANKVCSIINYDFSKKGNTYFLVRHNDPPNNYSDGTFAFEYDGNENLKSVSFHNSTNTENWQRIIEMNEDGYVNCYIDKTKNVVRQSLCMIYHKETGAKHPVEIISTVFEEDGVSYFQKNNTTGLSRVRDKMTMEWSPWK